MAGIRHRTKPDGTVLNNSLEWFADHDIDPGAVGENALADGIVSTQKLKTGAVTQDKLADGSVTSVKIAADTVIAADIAVGGVGSSELASDAVETAKIKDLAVTTGKLADEAVTNTKLGAASVTTDKLDQAMDYELDRIGHLEKFFTDEGWMQCMANQPIGYYWNGKTYITYQRYDLKIYAIYFDHTRQRWSDPTFIANNVFSEDFHGSPTIMKDDNHYLHVFFGVHGSAGLKHYKSSSPESISSWVAQSNVNLVSGSYPTIVRTGTNTFFMLFRGYSDVAHYSYIVSTNNMTSFGAPVEIADMGYHPTTGYAMYVQSIAYDSSRNAIHFVWYIWSYGALKDINIYHAYLSLNDGKVYSMVGVDCGAELSKAEADANCLVFDSSGNWAGSPHMVLDANFYPNLLYNDGGPSGSEGARFKFTRWNGSAWTAPVTLFDIQADWGILLRDGSNLEVYAGVQPFGSGGGIHGSYGSGTISSGTTYATVTHGCGFTPEAKHIGIVFTEKATNDPGEVVIDNITSSTFRVNVRNNPGATNLDFEWIVRKANALYRGQSIWKFKSYDQGATWILENTIIGGYEDGYGMWYPTAIMNWHSDLKVLFHDVAYFYGDLRYSDIDYKNYVFGLKNKMYCFGDNGFVMRRIKWV